MLVDGDACVSMKSSMVENKSRTLASSMLVRRPKTLLDANLSVDGGSLQ